MRHAPAPHPDRQDRGGNGNGGKLPDRQEHDGKGNRGKSKGNDDDGSKLPDRQEHDGKGNRGKSKDNDDDDGKLPDRTPRRKYNGSKDRPASIQASPYMTFEQLNRLPVWQRMPTIDLDRIAAVRLMNRVDTKYLVDEQQCMRLLEEAADRYYVQVIDTIRACRYSTLYYDTPQWEMYHLHHNRRLTRQKIRTRTYVETGVSFLEVKNKSNKGRTRKHRIRIGGDIFAAAPADADAAAFLRQESLFAPETLTPSLATRFVRVTLVNRTMTERLTIDFDLHFTNVRAAEGMEQAAEGMEQAAEDTHGAAAEGFKGSAGGAAALAGLVIIELKQDAMAPSPMKEILARLRIKPFKVSKYCIGEALTNPHVKHNRFKAKLRAIDKMSRNANKNITL